MRSKAGMAKRQGDVELGMRKNFFINKLGMRLKKFRQPCIRLLDPKE